MTIKEALKAISIYPIPDITIESIADNRGLNMSVEANQKTRPFRLAKADLLTWLSLSPDIGQQGSSFSLRDRKLMREDAELIYKSYGIETNKRRSITITSQ